MGDPAIARRAPKGGLRVALGFGKVSRKVEDSVRTVSRKLEGGFVVL